MDYPVICPSFYEVTVAEHLLSQNEEMLEPGDWVEVDGDFGQIIALNVRNGVVTAYTVLVYDCFDA